MGRMLPGAIAWRFLRSKKSHSAVGAISMVAVCGIAVATAAIVCVLSVFNGFRDVLGARFDILAPDIRVVPAAGKAFSKSDSLVSLLRRLPEIRLVTPMLADNALVIVDGREMPVMLQGVVPEQWDSVTSLRRALLPELKSRYFSAAGVAAATSCRTEAIAAIGTAARTGALTDTEILIFAPKRVGRVNLANPAASFVTDSARVTGVFRTDQEEYDQNMLIVPIATARKLFDRPDGASSLEIALRPGADPARATAKIKGILGDGFDVRDRDTMHRSTFRMINIEKWVSFMLLFFILLIAGFNIISSMSMLVLEKQTALGIFRALGMTRRATETIFVWQSFITTALGGAAGILLGVALCLLQQHFSLITIDTGDGFMPYPVRVRGADLAVTLIPLAVIGGLTAILSARYARRLMRKDD